MLVAVRMGHNLKLKSLRFKAGASPTAAPLEITCPNVVVLIGPNNAGKSQVLRDIESEFGEVNTAPSRIVIQSLEIDMPNAADEITEQMALYDADSAPDAPPIVGYRWYRRPSMAGLSDLRIQIPRNAFEDWLRGGNLPQLKTNFVRFFTRRLDGATRFNLVSDQPSGALESLPANHLWSLFQNPDAREKISAFTQAAFGRFFVIDPTGMTSFRMRLSDHAPAVTCL